jgi:hypothetical protein
MNKRVGVEGSQAGYQCQLTHQQNKGILLASVEYNKKAGHDEDPGFFLFFRQGGVKM